MSDDMSGIFEHLTPQDFMRSSARHVAVWDQQSFEEFVNACLDMVRFAFHASDGSPDPVALLIGTDGRRLYAPDEDETLGQYLDRLSREAKEYGAHSLFTMWLTKGGTYESDHFSRIDSDENLAKVQGGLKPVIYWYAQYGQAVRHGIMTIVDGDTGDVFEAPAEHAAPVYRAVLGT